MLLSRARARSRPSETACQTGAVDEPELRRRFAASPVARLATVRRDGQPHIVPVVFVLADDLVFSAVDGKAKKSTRLQRLINVESEPRCSLLVDHYEDDWSRLWWVRADGLASVVEPAAASQGMLALVERHPQYRQLAPPGPLLAVRVTRWTGWSANP
jgi:PPOX class probable F420-dependent enzyme